MQLGLRATSATGKLLPPGNSSRKSTGELYAVRWTNQEYDAINLSVLVRAGSRLIAESEVGTFHADETPASCPD